MLLKRTVPYIGYVFLIPCKGLIFCITRQLMNGIYVEYKGSSIFESCIHLLKSLGNIVFLKQIIKTITEGNHRIYLIRKFPRPHILVQKIDRYLNSSIV